jgi:squalene-hopene/tetraprenyl-beta-curcumene cyclase
MQIPTDVSGKPSALSYEMTGIIKVSDAIKKAQAYLLNQQHPDGYWVGELEADVSVSAGFIPLMIYMTGKVQENRQKKIIQYVKSKQCADGGWSTFFGGPGDLNVSIQAYFALKLSGISSSEPFMQKARDFILDQGGVSQANVFTKTWLALFGQYEWRGTPSIPPEIILLPNWFYFHIYEFASWSRETIMALVVVLTQKPVCHIPESSRIDELFLEPPDERDYRLGKIERIWSWRSFFIFLDSFFKIWERLPFHPVRKFAMRRVERWIINHQEADGSWGGIMLPWVYSLFALKSLGYELDHPVIKAGLQGLEDFIIEDENTFRLQPAVSPIWDTAWAVLALRESGLPPDHPALKKASDWMLSQEIKVPGDWSVKNPNTRPGGWAFEFENDLYPDLDDSALVPRALIKTKLPDSQEIEKQAAISRCIDWVLEMQSRDGGWAAFDRDNNKKFLTYVPFADFMSPLDPTCPDVTAHVIELLVDLEMRNESFYQAVSYLKGAQEEDGAWYGRWGVNYLYGTGLTLAALSAAGEDPNQKYIVKAFRWLNSVQNPDGGWGETCQTYSDPTQRGKGPSTASQTAWVLIGMSAIGQAASSSVRDGIEFLLQTQQKDGSWEEPDYTGTGFPKVFYLRYDLYRIYFPLISLARYRDVTGNSI